MKSNLRAILVTVIALALCLTALMPAAFAETADNSAFPLAAQSFHDGASFRDVIGPRGVRASAYPRSSACGTG